MPDFDETVPETLSAPHGNAHPSSFHPGPQSAYKFIALFKAKSKQLNSSHAFSDPTLPSGYFPGAASVILTMCHSGLQHLTLQEVETRLKTIDARNRPTSDDEHEALRLYYFYGDGRTWDECVRDKTLLLKHEQQVLDLLDNPDLLEELNSPHMPGSPLAPLNLQEFIEHLNELDDPDTYVRQLLSNGPVSFKRPDGFPSDLGDLFDRE